MTIQLEQQSGFLTAGGKNLEWAVFGDVGASLPMIILLHEGLGCLALWRDFPTRLAKATGLPVFAHSRAGYGASDCADLPRPLDYMTREARVTLKDILSQLGERRFILMGHSDGATIAAEYMGHVQDHRVRGLVLMAPHFFTEPEQLKEIAKAKSLFDAGGLAKRMAKYHKNPENCFRGWNDAWLHPDFKEWNVADVIDYFRVPALVIQGRDDQYGSLAQVNEVVERSYAPVETAIFDDCAHSPHFDQPEKTLQAVGEFVQRILAFETIKVAKAS